MKITYRVRSLTITDNHAQQGLASQPCATVILDEVDANNVNLRRGNTIQLTVQDPTSIDHFKHGKRYQAEFTEVE